VGKLYSGRYFVCRRCNGLVYRCQQESPPYRLTRKARKIRAKIGGTTNLTDPFPSRPKGMHWMTYLRLMDRAHEADMRSLVLAGEWFRKVSEDVVEVP
jgi:hypothetical protein